MLKDGHHEGLTPGEFRATLDGNREDDGSTWCNFSVRAGRFVVFSNLEGAFAAMMGSPLSAVLVTEEDEAVALIGPELPLLADRWPEGIATSDRRTRSVLRRAAKINRRRSGCPHLGGAEED